MPNRDEANALLEHGNRLRAERARLLQKLRDLENPDDRAFIVHALIDTRDPGKAVGGLGVLALLRTLDGIGEQKANAVVRPLGLPLKMPGERLRNLSDRQRNAICRWIAGKWDI